MIQCYEHAPHRTSKSRFQVVSAADKRNSWLKVNIKFTEQHQTHSVWFNFYFGLGLSYDKVKLLFVNLYCVDDYYTVDSFEFISLLNFVERCNLDACLQAEGDWVVNSFDRIQWKKFPQIHKSFRVRPPSLSLQCVCKCVCFYRNKNRNSINSRGRFDLGAIHLHKFFFFNFFTFQYEIALMGTA